MDDFSEFFTLIPGENEYNPGKIETIIEDYEKSLESQGITLPSDKHIDSIARMFPMVHRITYHYTIRYLCDCHTKEFTSYIQPEITITLPNKDSVTLQAFHTEDSNSTLAMTLRDSVDYEDQWISRKQMVYSFSKNRVCSFHKTITELWEEICNESNYIIAGYSYPPNNTPILTIPEPTTIFKA